MSQRSNLFSEHATRYAATLTSEPTLTLSVYCRRHLVSYTGLRKWMYMHNMKPSDLKREQRNTATVSPGAFVMMPTVKGCSRYAADETCVLHDVSVTMPGGINVSIGSADVESLALLLSKINLPCSH